MDCWKDESVRCKTVINKVSQWLFPLLVHFVTIDDCMTEMAASSRIVSRPLARNPADFISPVPFWQSSCLPLW